jgi:hypothetical protein
MPGMPWDHYDYHDNAWVSAAPSSGGLRSLRQITIHIPQDLVHYAKQYYLQGILRQVKECLREKAALHRLLLVIVFNVWPESEVLRQIKEQKSGEEWWHRAEWFLKQLRQLRQSGLMDLFMELRVMNDGRGLYEPVHDYDTEATLEKYVMGETYNRMERGKRELQEIE